MAFTVFADQNNNIFDHPDLELAGQSGRKWSTIPEKDLIPLPEGSRLFTMPGRPAVGWDSTTEGFTILPDSEKSLHEKRGESPDEESDDRNEAACTAVAAFLPPGFTRLYLPAVPTRPLAPPLPLWTYTAVGWTEHGFSAAAVKVDPMTHSDPCHYDDREIMVKAEERLASDPNNRLLHHLKHCALSYHCLAAKNLFMGRWEAPLPTSPSCNASCTGCLSYQPEDGCTASHDRIDFIPSSAEIVRTAVPHLTHVPRGIVSFGQGCEGEPLLQIDLLENAIRSMRTETDQGTIHLNTNGYHPQSILRLRRAGLDSIRISLNSSLESYYNAYYQPRGYTLKHVVKSIRTAVDSGLYTALNLLVFPGITDQEKEVSSLFNLIRTTPIQMLQLRNLSIDPELYLRLFDTQQEAAIGIRNLIRLLRKEFPAMEIGYFNRPRELFGTQLIHELSV